MQSYVLLGIQRTRIVVAVVAVVVVVVVVAAALEAEGSTWAPARGIKAVASLSLNMCRRRTTWILNSVCEAHYSSQHIQAPAQPAQTTQIHRELRSPWKALTVCSVIGVPSFGSFD